MATYTRAQIVNGTGWPKGAKFALLPPTHPGMLDARRVCTISYRTRAMGAGGEGVEDGIVEGYWTGEIDTWGKYTLRGLDGQTRYLFADEIIAVEG